MNFANVLQSDNNDLDVVTIWRVATYIIHIGPLVCLSHSLVHCNELTYRWSIITELGRLYIRVHLMCVGVALSCKEGENGRKSSPQHKYTARSIVDVT